MKRESLFLEGIHFLFVCFCFVDGQLSKDVCSFLIVHTMSLRGCKVKYFSVPAFIIEEGQDKQENQSTVFTT